MELMESGTTIEHGSLSLPFLPEVTRFATTTKEQLLMLGNMSEKCTDLLSDHEANVVNLLQ